MAVTWNPADKAPSISLTNGNLTASILGAESAADGIRATEAKSSGKWYWEIDTSDSTSPQNFLGHGIGVCDGSYDLISSPLGVQVGNAWSFGEVYLVTSDRKYHDGTGESGGGTDWDKQLISIAVDFDLNKIWWAVDGVWRGDPAAGTGEAYSNLTGYPLFPAMSMDTGAGIQVGIVNFGETAFAYTPPSGFAGFGEEQPNWYKVISITGEAGAGTNYQIKLEVGESAGSGGADFHLAGRTSDFPSAKDDGGDLKFTDSTGATLLDFWVEAVSGSGPNRTATIWVEVAADLGTNKDIRCYFNDSGASNLSDGDSTFLFFDDFKAGSLDGAKWDTSGAPAVDGSDNAVLDNSDSILGKTSFGVGVEIRARSKADEQDIVFVALTDDHWFNPAENNISLENSDANFPDDFDRIRASYRKATVFVRINHDGWTDFRNTYYQYWIKRFSISSVISGQESDSVAYSDTTYLPTVDLKPNFQVWDTSQESTLTVDWVFVKKVQATEPAFSSAGNAITEDELAEAIDLGDTVVGDHLVVTLEEALNLGDVLSTAGSIFSVTLIEALDLTDTVAGDHLVVALTEAIDLSDSVTVASTFERLLTEDLLLDDTVAGDHLVVELTEAIDLDDVTTAASIFERALTEAIDLGDLFEALNWTQWLADNSDVLVTHYFLTLTGDADSTTDIEIPMKSFQSSLSDGESTRLSVVIPGIVFGGVDYAAEINARSNGDLKVEMAFLVDGVEQQREILVAVDLEDIRIDEGSVNQSITLSGHRTEAFVSKTVILDRSTFYNLGDDGKMRYRFAEPDLYLKPGDTVQTRTDEFIVGLVTYFVDVSRQQMELTEN